MIYQGKDSCYISRIIGNIVRLYFRKYVVAVGGWFYLWLIKEKTHIGISCF